MNTSPPVWDRDAIGCLWALLTPLAWVARAVESAGKIRSATRAYDPEHNVYQGALGATKLFQTLKWPAAVPSERKDVLQVGTGGP